MILDLRARALCTIHARTSDSTTRHVAQRTGIEGLTHLAIEVWFERHHELDGRALWLARSEHVITLCAYDERAPHTIHVLSEHHSSNMIARQLSWRAKLPAHLLTSSKFTLLLDEDDTSQNLSIQDHGAWPSLRVTATYPRYVREDEPEPLLSASLRRYEGTPGKTLLLEQRCEPFATWTVQSHRASEFTSALGATLHQDFEATITSVRLHHAPNLSLTTSTSS